MNECLKLQESNCRNCYKCIRHCPVKAISFQSNQANIVQDECILCGRCFVNCPQNAKSIRNDLPTAKLLLQESVPVYASVAPSFAANYRGVNFESLGKALMKLGFAGAEETAVGATIVKKHYDAMVDSGKYTVIISSCCHTVNLLIQRYYPGVLPYLAKVQSPMQAHSAAIKREHPHAKTVFIGPCISKKAEADQYPGLVDCVLTFEELTQWLTDEQIALTPEVSAAQEGKARLFPLAGGILRSMRADNKEYKYLVVDGVENCIAALDEIADGVLERCFIEMSACKGSCIGGPAMERGTAPVGSYIAVEKQAGSEDFPVKMPESAELEKEISSQSFPQVSHVRGEIEAVLEKMGKTRPADELNCGSCGYNSCREKAAAILAGKANISMCLPYLMARAQSFSETIIYNTPNGIVVLNEALEVQQLNAAACSIMNIRAQKDVIGRPVADILDPSLFDEVMTGRQNVYERKVFLERYRRYVMHTVIHDHNFHIVISIMRDVTENEEERARKKARDHRTIKITDEVVEKQLRTVQEIASLLGETAAETKIAFTKVKEILRNE